MQLAIVGQARKDVPEHLVQGVEVVVVQLSQVAQAIVLADWLLQQVRCHGDDGNQRVVLEIGRCLLLNRAKRQGRCVRECLTEVWSWRVLVGASFPYNNRADKMPPLASVCT